MIDSSISHPRCAEADIRKPSDIYEDVCECEFVCQDADLHIIVCV